jgi:hypothetical protein
MDTLTGQLVTQKDSKFTGHRIQLYFQEVLDIGISAEEKVFAPTHRSVVASPEGLFELVLPGDDHVRGPFLVEVLAPDGERLFRESHDARPSELRIAVDPKEPFAIAEHPDRFRGRRAKLTGRVLDTAGRPRSGVHVRIVARAMSDQAGNGEEDQNELQVILATVSDRTGYFSGDYPRGTFAEALGVLGANVSIPIRLGDGAFPRQLILVGDLPEDLGGEPGEPPRAPDPEDRVNSPETFSSDIGGGRCVDFTTPNRVLEEFSFFKVVRTTEPAIRGTTVVDPKPLPPNIRDLIGRAITPVLDAVLAAPAPPGGATAPRPRALATGTTRSLEETRRITDTLRIASLRLRPDLIRSLADDEEGITLERLAEAERRTGAEETEAILRAATRDVSGRAPLTGDNQVDWDDTPTFYQSTEIAHGHLLHFKQIWKADGYSLGDLAYSLPLAPCQKKTIAIVDWERRETAARSEALTEEEQLAASLSRDRDIREIVTSSVEEESSGQSSSRVKAIGGGIGGVVGPVLFGVAGGFSSASSSASQESARRSAADSLQSLNDRVVQAASAVRSQRATVVQTVRQGESVRVETEIVANHNHCHALTIEYFEVLRHFQIATELVEVQECLFVPFPMTRFDRPKALRWREPLSRFLLDEPPLRFGLRVLLQTGGLRAGFDALERIHTSYQGVDVPQASFAEEVIEHLDGDLRLKLSLVRPRDPRQDEDRDLYLSRSWGFWDGLGIAESKDDVADLLAEATDKEQVFQEQIAPKIAIAFIDKLELLYQPGSRNTQVDFTLVSDYGRGISLYVTFTSSTDLPPVQRDAIQSLVIQTSRDLPAGSRAIVESMFVRYRTAHLSHHLFRGRVRNDLSRTDSVSLPTPLDRSERRNPQDEDQRLGRRLLKHLNEHLEYYHRAIWLSMDRERRYMLLDGFEAPNSDGRSVASVVENRLIGIVGNSLVLPVAPGFQTDPQIAEARENLAPGEEPPTLLDLYAPLAPPPPVSVSVPTRGVFAEAVLGACNSCEEIDESRFWRWDEASCPGETPAIQPVSTETRRAEPPSLQPTPFPTPLVALQNIPSAPDPSGLAGVLALLGRPDLFRDITGLSGTQQAALAGLQSALQAAQFFGGKAADLELQKRMAQQIKTTLGTIDQQRKGGNLTDEQARKLSEDAIRSMIGGSTRPPAETLNKELGVEEAVRQGRPVSATRTDSDGSQTVRIEEFRPPVVAGFRSTDVPPLVWPSDSALQPNFLSDTFIEGINNRRTAFLDSAVAAQTKDEYLPRFVNALATESGKRSIGETLLTIGALTAIDVTREVKSFIPQGNILGPTETITLPIVARLIAEREGVLLAWVDISIKQKAQNDLEQIAFQKQVWDFQLFMASTLASPLFGVAPLGGDLLGAILTVATPNFDLQSQNVVQEMRKVRDGYRRVGREIFREVLADEVFGTGLQVANPTFQEVVDSYGNWVLGGWVKELSFLGFSTTEIEL